MSFKEIKQHGKEDFPLQLYKLDCNHPKYIMAMHWHSSVEIVHVISGNFTLTLDNRLYTLKGGDVCFINSETVHGGTPDNCIYECLVFNPLFIKNANLSVSSFIERLLENSIIVDEKIEDEELKMIILELFKASDKNDPAYSFIVIGLIFKLFGYIQLNNAFKDALPETKQELKKALKIKKVLKFIRENYSSVITLDDMAKVANLSPNYFSNYFKSITNSTPMNYLISYRIEKASTKLLSTDKSITNIAYDTGFSDLSYFIKLFKKHTGYTPSEYRNQNK